MAEAKKEEVISGDLLQDFKFDDNEVFFGIEKKEDDLSKIVKQVKTDEEIDASKVEIESDDDEELEPFSTEDGKETLAKTETSATEDVEVDDEFFTTLSTEMKDKGIFQNIDLKDGEKITQEKFFELQDAEIEARVDETIEALLEGLDEDGKAFLKHKRDGGSTQDFMNAYQTTVITNNIDVTNERDQEYVLTTYLKTYENMDSEEITDRIEWLKESGKIGSFTQKYLNKIKADEDSRKESLRLEAEENLNKREEASKKFNLSLNTELDKIDVVGSFKFSKDDKKELLNYITKPSVKVGKNQYVTPFTQRIGEIFKGDGENKKELLLLAKLVKSNFDVKDLIDTTKTAVIAETKSKLQQAKTGVKPSTSSSYNKKSLADFNF